MSIPTPDTTNPPWRYRLLVRVLSPVLVSYTLWRVLKDGGTRYWWQRLGLYFPNASPSNEHNQDQHLWVHAASVGEVFTVLPLIKNWLDVAEDRQVLVTTGTPTGAAVLAQQSIPRIRHQYLPVDFPGACQRFVRQANVQQGWIVETEIWPWLYARCQQNNIELTIINGRLSERTSTQATGILASSYKRALNPVKVLARSAIDQERFLALGAQARNVHVVGNLKYSGTTTPDTVQSLLQQPYVLAASTHEDEELMLASAWQSVQTDNTVFVIVPRHPERGAAIARQLKNMGLRVSQRSLGEHPKPADDIYLADTLGELQTWYQHAMGAFVGGSLITRGGHNMLEPARYGCPVVVGPHTHNFDDIMELMLHSNAIATEDTAEKVVQILYRAAQKDTELHSMAQRALLVAQDTEGVLHRYTGLLENSVNNN